MSSTAPTKQCLQRLQKELRALQNEPNPLFQAAPDPDNILVWYFLLRGPPDTPYVGGRYVGQIKFPPDYPFKPPSILLCTPNGRFRTNSQICLSNSSSHPEQWSPVWGVNTIITGFLSFFTSEEGATGAISTSPERRRALAAESRAFNVERLTFVYRRVMREAYEEDVKWLADEKAAAEQQALMPGPQVEQDVNRTEATVQPKEQGTSTKGTTAAVIVLLIALALTLNYILVN